MKNRNNFYKIDLKEQETIINIDYYAKQIYIYTSRPSVYKRLEKKLGEPTKTYTTNALISGGSWTISFADSQVKNIITKSLFLGEMK